MKIAFIGEFNKLHDEEGKARSFEKLGHAVFRFSESSFSQANMDDVLDCEPDILLYAKLKIDSRVKKILIDKAKEKGIKTICWVPDLYWGLGREHKISTDYIFKSDLVLTPDGGNDKRWADLGINHRVLRQGIFDSDCFLGDIDTTAPEIVFVGTANGEWQYRQELLHFLRRTYGNRFKWRGIHNSEEVRGPELNVLYNSVPIIIGDSVYSPYYWSNRIYETIGRGGFMIHPLIEGIDKEFEPYKHFIPYYFNDMDGLREKIEYFITRKDKRDEIRFAGMEHVKKNHTLLNRCEELCSMM